MKNILLIFACALFVSTSAFAQLSDTDNGAVTVDVVKHLEINLDEVDVQFTYNEHELLPPNNNNDWNGVTIKANVDWKLEVVAVGGADVLTNDATGTTIPANLLTYYLTDVVGVVNTALPTIYPFSPAAASPPFGSLNATFKMNWQLTDLTPANLYSGDYTIGVNYILTEESPI
ncbi:hypothetical protein [Ancylomarina sp.]|uniref:hypothetical protein n=1 Tax=Ancylomarina sp. TaxID=1970196 RepID=UPI00356141E5